jgi:hypothetical protein
MSGLSMQEKRRSQPGVAFFAARYFFIVSARGD